MEKEFGIRCYRPITLLRKSALNIIAGHLRGKKRICSGVYTRLFDSICRSVRAVALARF